MINSIKRLDIFDQPIPGFQVKGEGSTLKTILGAVCTVMVSTLVLLYALVKGIHLINRQSPTITEYKEATQIIEDNQIYLNSSSSKFAFSFKGFADGELKDDSRYVKWFVRMTGK